MSWMLLPLAPKNIEQLRVVTELPVPGLPLAHRARLNLVQLPEVVPLGHQNVQPVMLPSGEDPVLAVIDKPDSHTLLDMMVIQAGPQVKYGICDLTPDEMALTMEVFDAFARHVYDPAVIQAFRLDGHLPRISFNFDPLTRDRPGLQSIERFHAHMYLMDPVRLAEVARHQTPLGSVPSPGLRRRLVDPLSFLAPQILWDLHYKHLKVAQGLNLIPLRPEETVKMGHPLGFNLRLSAGWRTVTDLKFRNYLRAMHETMDWAYREIYAAFTGSPFFPAPGQRRSLLPGRVIQHRLMKLDWLSVSSLGGLYTLAVRLKNAPPVLVRASSRHESRAVQHVVLNGLAYAMSLSSLRPIGASCYTDSVELTITPRLFTDIGGAGLFGCNEASAVILARSRGEWSDLEIERRREFQRSLLQALTSVSVFSGQRQEPTERSNSCGRS